jgi:hypothetical protein
MSCSSRVKKSGGRRLDNNSSNSSNNRRSLLFLLGSSSTSDGMANNPASAWFHNSLQHLSHSWHRFNKFGISRDKKADRCSTWFVDQADNNNKPLPFYSFARFVCLTSVFLCLDFIHPSIRTFISFVYLFIFPGGQSVKNRSTFSIDSPRSANVPILKGFRPEDVVSSRMTMLSKKLSLEPTGSTSWTANGPPPVLN